MGYCMRGTWATVWGAHGLVYGGHIGYCMRGTWATVWGAHGLLYEGHMGYCMGGTWASVWGAHRLLYEGHMGYCMGGTWATVWADLMGGLKLMSTFILVLCPLLQTSAGVCGPPEAGCPAERGARSGGARSGLGCTVGSGDARSGRVVHAVASINRIGWAGIRHACWGTGLMNSWPGLACPAFRVWGPCT